jgi:hypothetical protein
MSQFAFALLTVMLAGSLVSAQKRIEAGVFLDYVGISETSTSNFGIGGRFGYRVHHKVMLEGELTYDYGINFHELYIDVATGNLAAVERTSIGVTHGLFGPKLQPQRGRFRPFLTIKAGFMDFRFSPSLLSYSNFVSAIVGLRTSALKAALYPGGGLEATVGPLGVRLELGDEVYFNYGVHNNLRITFGPFLRF